MVPNGHPGSVIHVHILEHDTLAISGCGETMVAHVDSSATFNYPWKLRHNGQV